MTTEKQRDVNMGGTKKKLKKLIEIQSRFIQGNYNAGLFNGLVTAYNTQYKDQLPLCAFNETLKKWEL